MGIVRTRLLDLRMDRIKKEDIDKTEIKNTMEVLREIRDQIGLEIKDMKFEELQKYIEDNSTLHNKGVWAKD